MTLIAKRLRTFGQNDRGSSLLLAPTAILILVILAAVTVDSGLHFLAQRQLQNAAAGLANDISAQAISWSDFYNSDGSVLDIDTGKAQAIADARASRLNSSRLSNVHFSISVVGPTVIVDGQADSPAFFAPAIPGASRSLHIDIRESADLVRH